MGILMESDKALETIDLETLKGDYRFLRAERDHLRDELEKEREKVLFLTGDKITSHVEFLNLRAELETLKGAAERAYIVIDQFGLDTANGITYCGVDEGEEKGKQLEESILAQLREALKAGKEEK